MPSFPVTSEHVLLSVEEMGRADRLAEDAGTPSLDLMEAAGRGVAEEALARRQAAHAVVLAGPGNNGGDGFVAARHLAGAGVDVKVALLGGRAKKDELKGDAATMAGRFRGPVVDLAPEALAGADMIVDALFGAGLSRPIEGGVAEVVEAANRSAAYRVAVDVPSGILGDTGAPCGAALRAHLTVTFFRKKPGHLLLPGRFHCGHIAVRDIGIPASALEEIGPKTFENAPALWLDDWPELDPGGHKYHRGHAVAVGGRPPGLGASRMVALAALRAGAGLVTLATPEEGYGPQAAALMEVMVWPFSDLEGFKALIADERKNVVALGPGNKADEETRRRVLACLGAKKRVVLDADAITAFQDDPAELFGAIASDTVLTPHPGEFKRLFGSGSDPDKLTATRRAAEKSGAVVLQKGADTVIAAPDGRAVIDPGAYPHLATAGAGDVLTGIVTGVLAEGMPALAGAACAQWLQGAAAAAHGRGMISGDLIAALPGALQRLEGLRTGRRKPSH